MRPALAQGLFVLLNVVAVPLVVYGVHEPVRVIAAVRAGTDPIAVDSGIQYLILMSVMWVLLGLQVAGLKGGASFVRRWGGKIVVGWFVACVVIAALIPLGLRTALQQAGYHACADPAELSRLSVGDSLIYVKAACPE